MRRALGMRQWSMTAAAAAGVATSLMGGCVLSSDMMNARYTETREIRAEHVPGSPLQVRAVNGAVAVQREAVDEVVIVAKLRARTQERLDETRIYAERTSSGELSIGVEWPDDHRLNSESCSFDISLPDTSAVDVKTSNGAILIDGLGGLAELTTSNGSITVSDHEGGINAHTSNGAITLEQIQGDVVAETSNGRVEVEEAAGSVRVTTSNGGVMVRLDDASEGPVDVDTTNGNIRLVLSPSVQGVYELSTRLGRIDFVHSPSVVVEKSSKNYVRLRFGENDNRSEVRTSNGSIKLRVQTPSK